MSLLGLIMFSAPYLPWILLWISMLLNNRNTMSADLVGMGAGHLYYFLAYVYPKVCYIACNFFDSIVAVLVSTITSLSQYLSLSGCRHSWMENPSDHFHPNLVESSLC